MPLSRREVVPLRFGQDFGGWSGQGFRFGQPGVLQTLGMGTFEPFRLDCEQPGSTDDRELHWDVALAFGLLSASFDRFEQVEGQLHALRLGAHRVTVTGEHTAGQPRAELYLSAEVLERIVTRTVAP